MAKLEFVVPDPEKGWNDFYSVEYPYIPRLNEIIDTTLFPKNATDYGNNDIIVEKVIYCKDKVVIKCLVE